MATSIPSVEQRIQIWPNIPMPDPVLTNEDDERLDQDLDTTGLFYQPFRSLVEEDHVIGSATTLSHQIDDYDAAWRTLLKIEQFVQQSWLKACATPTEDVIIDFFSERGAFGGQHARNAEEILDFLQQKETWPHDQQVIRPVLAICVKTLWTYLITGPCGVGSNEQHTLPQQLKGLADQLSSLSNEIHDTVFASEIRKAESVLQHCTWYLDMLFEGVRSEHLLILEQQDPIWAFTIAHNLYYCMSELMARTDCFWKQAEKRIGELRPNLAQLWVEFKMIWARFKLWADQHGMAEYWRRAQPEKLVETRESRRACRKLMGR